MQEKIEGGEKKMNKYKRRTLILGIVSFCFFVASFIFGMFFFIKGDLVFGTLWTLFLFSNFLVVCSDIKGYKNDKE